MPSRIIENNQDNNQILQSCIEFNDLNTLVVEHFQSQVIDKPERFLLSDKILYEECLKSLTGFYKVLKQGEPYEMSPLKDILVQGFDVEQVWEQLQLQNAPMIDYLNEQVDEMIAQRDIGDVVSEEDGKVCSSVDEEVEGMSDYGDEDFEEIEGADDDDFHENNQEEDSDDLLNDNLDIEEENDIDNLEENEDWDQIVQPDAEEFSGEEYEEPREKLAQTTEVDDDFFSVREMEKFSEMAEEYDVRMSRGDFHKDSQDDQEDDDEDEQENEKYSRSNKKPITDDRVCKLRETFEIEDSYFNNDPDNLDMDDEDADKDPYDIRYEDFFEPKPKKKLSENINKRKRVHFDDQGNDSYDDSEDFMQNEDFDKNNFAEEASMFDDQEEGENEYATDINANESMKNSNSLFDDEENEEENLSNFEKKQRAMAKIIERLEQEAIAEKQWTLKGEVASKQRPVNSLLEEHIEVDYTKKLAPEVTEATTQSLEDMIKRRIRDEVFDDLDVKRPKNQHAFDPNRRIELSDEKSSKGLGQIYEDEYLKQKQGSEYKSEKTQALESQHVLIEGLFKNLCHQLDALSNWHFTPKAAKAELSVLPAPNVPAIAMEEAIPVAVNTESDLLAPKEVFAGKAEKSQQEKDSVEKKRERAQRKRVNKKRRLEKERDMQEKEKEAEATGKKLNERQEKNKALRQLEKQKNVTIIGQDNSKTQKKQKGDGKFNAGADKTPVSAVSLRL